MKIGDFSFMTRCSDGAINIVSLHRKTSLTWRFCLHRTRFNPYCKIALFNNISGPRNAHYIMNLPVIGCWMFQTQQEMPA